MKKHTDEELIQQVNKKVSDWLHSLSSRSINTNGLTFICTRIKFHDERREHVYNLQNLLIEGTITPAMYSRSYLANKIYGFRWFNRKFI